MLYINVEITSTYPLSFTTCSITYAHVCTHTHTHTCSKQVCNINKIGFQLLKLLLLLAQRHITIMFVTMIPNTAQHTHNTHNTYTHNTDNTHTTHTHNTHTHTTHNTHTHIHTQHTHNTHTQHTHNTHTQHTQTHTTHTQHTHTHTYTWYT